MTHSPKFKRSSSRKVTTSIKKVAFRPPVQSAGITEEMAMEWLNMEEKYASLKKAIESHKTTTQSPSPLIQRVSHMLRNHNLEKYFEPTVMAIGPLHHGKKPHFELAEQYKRRLAGLFVQKSGLDTDILYRKIWTEIQDLRKCFDQEAIKLFTDAKLGWILFVDGCAVLQLIKCVINNEWKELEIKTNELTIIIWEDLFLLENQIPLRVLELLRSSDPIQKNQWHWPDVIQRLVELNTEIESTTKIDMVNNEKKSTKEPVHLLDLLRAYLVPNSNTNEDTINSHSPKKKRDDNGWHIFRNVKDLKSAGISLQRTGTSHLTEISFTSGCFSGKLTLPVITVDDSTGSKFMNLIAYEMCPDYDNDFTITSYICFMDSLIDQAEDVRELRKARILLNFLGSDEEVARLFNEIGTDLVPNPSAYMRVKEEIENHCKNQLKTWMSEAYHDHFSSPWTIVAFFSVVVALLLTAIQTWFAVF